MDYQYTLAGTASFSGIGLHSGVAVNIRLVPAPANTGIVFRRVDLEGEAVNGAAQAIGITPNNAGVRLHRARKALLREVQRSCRTCATHGCLDCSCGQPGRAPE